MTADILKIQKAVRKSIEAYEIESKHGKDALVALFSVELYLALEEKPTPPKLKRSTPIVPVTT